MIIIDQSKELIKEGYRDYTKEDLFILKLIKSIFVK